MSGKLLIVEDEFIISQDIRRITSNLGYAVTAMAKSADEALRAITSEKPDLALLDINILGDSNGIELAGVLKNKHSIPFLYITSYSDSSILKKMNETEPLGYILKPFDKRDIRVALELAFTKLQSNSNRSLPVDVVKKDIDLSQHIVGESMPLKNVLTMIKQVANTDVTVLIEGETGVGKELMMEALFKSSNRSNKSLVKVNCATLPSELIESVLFGHEKGSFTGATEKRIGKFEQANGGTIFLDEIGELPLPSQSKLLRCLQEKEIETVGGSIQKKIDVRVIAATNKNLADEVKEGNFRADLYFRLNVFPIKVPPLRERKEDIVPLANYFLKRGISKFNKPNMEFDEFSLKKMKTYQWPGNIRELQHYIDRALLLATNGTVHLDLSDQLVNEEENKKGHELRSLEDVEREQIIYTLKYCKGKIRGAGGAAEILKLHPNTLDFRIKKLGIIKENLFT